MTHDEIYEERVARDKRNYPVMTHNHDFIKDLDGQVTCSICGARDDEMVSKSQLRRITVQNSYDIVTNPDDRD